jgi:enamine deaminase RidA (YjgF/YER057c/UK114 family)
VDRPVTTPHRIVNPPGMSRAVGFAHAVVAAAGRTVYLGGQTAHGADGELRGGTVAEQFDAAADNVVTALAACGAEPAHLVSLHIYTTDVAGYREALGELGVIYRRHFGRHYPATALFGVRELFDPAAVVELVCVAVAPAASAAEPGGGEHQ